MAVLTKEEILAAKDFRIERVECPEWGGYVMVKSMSGAQRDEFEFGFLDEKLTGKPKREMKDFRAALVARCVCDMEGNLLFSEEDVASLGEKNAITLQRIYNAAQRVSGMGDDAVEELKKNSDIVHSDNSFTISRASSKSGMSKGGSKQSRATK